MKATAGFIVVMLTLLCNLTFADVSIYEQSGQVTPNNPIDKLLFKDFDKQNITPANLSSDSVFLRRAYLDVTGTLPTVEQARKFLADQSPDKRKKLIDQLLSSDEFVDYWPLKWCDWLRVKSEFPINLWPNAVHAYHRWIHTAVKTNMPYDQFARELLTSSGSNFRVPQVNFYRAVQSKTPEGLANAAALTFMGTRADQWTDQQQVEFQVFFSRIAYKRTAEWKEEIVYFDTASPSPATATLPDGKKVTLKPDQDPRIAFADWLITDKNPWFARAAVNRVWYQMFGCGISGEADDIDIKAKGTLAKIESYLAKELVKSGYDLKYIFRLVLNSTTYQLASISQTDIDTPVSRYASYPIRRLDAEVLIDAYCQISRTNEQYMSKIPEPFTWVPESDRSIALTDGSISSSFLDMFGRPSRDTGMTNERNNNITASQRLHLLNSSHIRQKIDKTKQHPTIRRNNRKQPLVANQNLYLLTLSRFPTKQELAAIKQYYDENRGGKGNDPTSDLIWSLVNSPEFLYHH